MKNLGILFLLVASIQATDVLEIIVTEVDGSVQKIIKSDSVTEENFKSFVNYGMYDQCRNFLVNKTPEELETLRKKLNIQPDQFKEIMGEFSHQDQTTFTKDQQEQAHKTVQSYPLHAFSFFGDLPLVRWFLKSNPTYDVKTTTVTDFTAHEVADGEGHNDIVSFLKSSTRDKSIFMNINTLFLGVLFLINMHMMISMRAT